MEQSQSPATPAGAMNAWGLALLAIAATGACVALGLLLRPSVGLTNLAFLFLLPVVAMAGRGGLAAGLLTATLAALAYNFVFVPPTFTLHVAQFDNLMTLGMFALTALAVSQFAARLKSQAARAGQLAADSALLAQLSQDLSKVRDETGLEALLASRLAGWTGAHVQILTPARIESPNAGLSPLDHSAAQWAISHGEPAGKGAPVMAGADALFLPMESSPDEARLVQFWSGDSREPVSANAMPLIVQAVSRGGAALQRARTMQRQADLDARKRQDAMREALLASISHDLRTPLTAIRAGLDALPPDPAGVLAATQAQAGRLERMVTNLLDLARLGADALTLAHQATDLTDAVDAATRDMAQQLAGRPLSVSIEPDLPLVRTDPRMLHHMLINLIENGCKYSPDGAPITITARREGKTILLSITDCGAGLPEQPGEDLFARFLRGANADQVPGSGLGLAVVDGFAAALGLTVSAANVAAANVSAANVAAGSETGAVFTIRFPEDLLFSSAEEPL